MNQTNEGRVEKALDLIGLIVKSAEANSTSADEIANMLKPITEELTRLGAASHQQTRQPASLGTKPRADLVIKELAETAALPDLTTAVAVLLNRIDAHFAEEKTHDRLHCP